MKLFLSTLDLAYDHPIRKAWRTHQSDPREENQKRAVTFVMGILLLGFFAWRFANRDIVFTGDRQVFAVMLYIISFLLPIYWSVSFGFRFQFDRHVRECMKEIELQKPTDCSPEELRKRARIKLLSLAIQYGNEKTTFRNCPGYDHRHAERAEEKLLDAFHRFRRIGLVEGNTYEEYLERRKGKRTESD